jgi:hypothetical protein
MPDAFSKFCKHGAIIIPYSIRELSYCGPVVPNRERHDTAQAGLAVRQKGRVALLVSQGWCKDMIERLGNAREILSEPNSGRAGYFFPSRVDFSYCIPRDRVVVLVQISSIADSSLTSPVNVDRLFLACR